MKLREKLTPERISYILANEGVDCVRMTEGYSVYPTACHNAIGGSEKLYYYHDSHMFKCFTECDECFDIYELLVKIYGLRGEEITFADAVRIAGQSLSDIEVKEGDDGYDYLYKLMNMKEREFVNNTLNEEILKRYVFSADGVKSWLAEGISLETLRKYNIRYDLLEDVIVIPNYDIDGKLIGIRGRFMREDAYAKYKPLQYNGALLTFKSEANLFGISQNAAAIRKAKKVVIFEGEKSVLKADTIYGDDSICLACYGKNITNTHIKLLLSLGVEEVVVAFDADYKTRNELFEKQKEYEKRAKILSNYFSTSIILDCWFVLGEKASPIDAGKEEFEKLLKSRYYI